MSFRILGIDPGSNIAGFACIESKKQVPMVPRDFAIVTAGVVRFDRKIPHAQRIAQLHQSLVAIIKELGPAVCVVEKAFCGVNSNSALKLGEARGALISAVFSASAELVEMTPREAKKNITGTGAATKEDVANALKILIGFDLGQLPYDAADALALALSYGLKIPILNAMGAAPIKTNAKTL